MNVYEIDIWKQVKRNGEFSHTVTRLELVHALNEERAKKKVILAESRKWDSSNLMIEASSEFIYNIRKTGIVTKKQYYEYSDGRSPRRVKV